MAAARRKAAARRGGANSRDPYQGRLFALEALEPRRLLAPVIATSRSIQAPAAADPVVISSSVADTAPITSVNLIYGTGGSNTAFSETFGNTSVKPWTGSGANKPWTVAASNPLQLANAADYQGGNTSVGLQFSCKGATSDSITTNPINAAGLTASVQFWVSTKSLAASDGWAFQIDTTGTGNYTTYLSETGNSHAFQQYGYTLSSSQLSSNLKLRFAFTGTGNASDGGVVDLDQITVNVANATTLPMTAAGNGTYNATIPAQANGAVVSYFVKATDNQGNGATDPGNAPASLYSYTVRAIDTPPTISGTSQYPATPSGGNPVSITTNAADASAVAAVSLIYNAGLGNITVPMVDDGAHQDGAAGDGMYGASIPAFPAGTTVRYYVSVTNDAGVTSTDPGANLQSIGYQYSYTVGAASQSIPVVNALPGGTYTMGDQFNTVDPNHPTDEVPLHTVTLSPFAIGKFDVTDQQYCDYLNAAYAQGSIQVVNGIVCGNGTTDAYSETWQGQLALYGPNSAAPPTPPLATPYSGISWNGSHFSVVAGQQSMPMVGIYWDGSVAYANWLSASAGFQQVYSYDAGNATWNINSSAQGYRLPSEAEWEYAADGGNTNPYSMYSWGNDPNTNGSYANTLGSGSPWAQSGTLNLVGQTYPWTTPVGFYNGQLQQRSAFGWTGNLSTYQTSNAENGFGLYDMGGNVWQWTNDWYLNNYYSSSPINNPTGPATGSYHTLRGGSWAQPAADATVSARDPSVNREPLHNTTYASIGFRLVLAATSPVEPLNTLTTVATNLTAGRGITADPSGNVYYSDTGTNTILKLSAAGATSVFKSNAGGASGLMCDARGNVVAAQSSGQVVTINAQGTSSVLASQYNDLPLNAPSTLWIDPQGGIYFADPVATPSQPQAVYYLTPDRTNVVPVITDLSQPAGIAGNSAGTLLYVSDAASGTTYVYNIRSGTVTNPTPFAAVAASGIAVDTLGNVYLTTSGGVQIYSSAGTLLSTIATPAAPVGLTFGGSEKRTLFILTPHALYSIGSTTQGETINGAPTIAGTTRDIISPLATETDWVTSNVTDDGSLSSVQLSYTVGGSGLPVTEFTETFASTATARKAAWDGTGGNNPWTVSEPSAATYVTQQTTANYGSGNVCGLQFAGGTTNPADTMVTTVNPINTAGATATVQFYLQCVNASSVESWTFQVSGDGGTTWTTAATETASKHSWQVYNLTLRGAELSGNTLLRFQYTGNGTGDTVDVDNITVQTTFGNTTVVPMYDDSLHHDGAAGDSVWGAQIPAFPTGTVVVYHVIATDNTGQVSVDPPGAPYYYSYKVGQAQTAVQFNEVMANATVFQPTADYPTKDLGLLSSSIVGNTTAGNLADGYLLVPAMSGSNVYLVDTQGHVINQWTSSYNSTGRSVFITPDGSLIRSSSLTGAQNPIIGENVGGVIEKFDWQGNRVGYFTYAGYDAEAGTSNLGFAQHHNILVMPNGNILMTTVQSYTPAQCLAAGFNPTNLFGGTNVLIDGVVEVKPDWAHDTYTTVWQWCYFNHLVQNYNPNGQTFYTNSQGQTVYVGDYAPTINNPYKLNANFNGSNTPIEDRLFAHQNGLDYNPALDEIVVSARVCNEIYIIDHSTTTDQAATGSGGLRGHGGDFLYRWGNPSMYGAPGNETLFMQHNAQWIPAGFPGAGDITVMNNGNNRPGVANLYTIASEITPPVNPDGSYNLLPNAAYGPLTETWTYTDTPPSAFYNSDGGGVQRMANGDTMISYDTLGLAFEVTPAGQIVWQFQNGDDGSKGAGHTTDTILFQGDSPTPDYNLLGGYTTTVYNCPWYPANYFTFTNQHLYGSGTIEQYRDWFELYNTGNAAVDLSNMYLSNNPSNPTMWQVPAGTSIPAQSTLLFYADDDTASSVTTPVGSAAAGVSLPAATIAAGTTTGFPTSGTILVTTSAGIQTVTYTGVTATSFLGCQGGTGTMSKTSTISMPNTAANRHTNFTLSAAGGTIYLYDVDGITQAAAVSYPALGNDVAYARVTDGTGNWAMTSVQTPGWPNQPTAPTGIALSSTSVADYQPVGTAVGTLSATDADPFDTYTFTLVSGTGSDGNGAFAIVGNLLQTNVILHATTQNSYNIRLRATDANGLYVERVFTISVSHVNQPPVVVRSGLANFPLPGQPLTIASTVTDEQGLGNVTLLYYDESQFPQSTPFSETFGNTVNATWNGGNGTGTDNLWTTTGSSNPFKLTSSANYQSNSTLCGVQYTCAKTANAAIVPTNTINLAGVAASVQFWVYTRTVTAADGWALQIDPTGTGGNYVTCLTETGNSHAFQQYTYNLNSSQLTGNVALRWLFTGGGTGDAGIIDVDQITVSLSGNPLPVSVPMTLGNGVYTAQIPAKPSGTPINYYITANNVVGLSTSDPASGPATMYSFTVQPTQATSLAFNNGSAGGTYGGNTTLQARLTSAGVPVAHETVVFTLQGASLGNAVTDANGNATLSGIRLAGRNAGNYASGLRASFAGDFALNAGASTAAQDLVLQPAPLTITVNNQTKAYGDSLPTFTATITGFVNGDSAVNFTTPPTFIANATASSHVGNYTISGSGAASPNYTIRYTLGNLTITPAPLTIAANNQSKLYGAALPTLTANYAGFVNGDTAANLTTPPTLTANANAASPIGNYTITPGGAVDADYAIGYANGTLQIVAVPGVLGSVPATLGPTNATTLNYTVTFAAPVVSLVPADFQLTATGNAAGNVASVSGNRTSFTVAVAAITGDGALRLDLLPNTVRDTDGLVVPGYTSGATVTLDHTPPVLGLSPTILNNPQPALAGLVNDAMATVSVSVGGKTYAAVNNGSSWSLAAGAITPALADGLYTIAVTATDPAGNVGSGNTTLLIDTKAPVSTIQALAATQSGLSFTITVSGGDPAPAAGVAVAGVSYIAVSYSTDGVNYTPWQNFPAGPTSATFTVPAAQSGLRYNFRALAHDAAGNVESKVSPDAYTIVPDEVLPVATVSGWTVNAATGLINLTLQGSDSGASGLASFALYAQIDGGGSYTAVNTTPIPTGTPTAGVYQATYAYQGLMDGKPHTYRFYALGTNGQGYVQPAPGAAQQTVTQTFAAATPAVTAFQVQNGQQQRSRIEYLNVTLNSASTVQVLAASVSTASSRVKLVRYDLNGNNPVAVAVTPSAVKAVDSVLAFDFGTPGITGNATSNAGDGYYALELDLTGNGTFGAVEHFYRLLGDVNGDHTVNNTDLTSIVANYGKTTAAALQNDLNGDGVVNGNDLLAARSNAAAAATLKAGLPLDG